jgi:DNA-binding beta-propeller fold protein YncE
MPLRRVLNVGLYLSIVLGLWWSQGQAAEVWVTSMEAGTVQVIDADSHQVMTTLPADKGAHNVTFSPDATRAFIANVGANTITIVDAERKQVLGECRCRHTCPSRCGRP